MKPNETAYSNDDNLNSSNSDALKNESHESFVKEKDAQQKKSSKNNITDAPFYDELHFANYE